MALKSSLSLVLFALLLSISYANIVRMHNMNKYAALSIVGKADATSDHEVVFALKQLNMDYLERTVNERSTPGSLLYQEWMSFDEIGAITANEEGYKIVMEWLNNFNVTVTWKSAWNHYFKVTGSIDTFETMFTAEFFNWINTETNHAFVRSETYHLPATVAPHVSCVFNTVQAPPLVTSHVARRPYKTLENGEKVHPFKTTMFMSDQSQLRGDPKKGSSNLDSSSDSTTEKVSEYMTAHHPKKSNLNLEATTVQLVTVDFLNHCYGVPSNQGMQNVLYSSLVA